MPFLICKYNITCLNKDKDGNLIIVNNLSFLHIMYINFIKFIEVNKLEKYIKYFYNIDSNDIHKEGYNYFFSDMHHNLFCLYNISKQTDRIYNVSDLKYIYEISNYLNVNNIYCHKIVLNINYELIVVVNNNTYVLLWYNNNYNNKLISIKDIEYYSNVLLFPSKKNISSWKELWSNKIDYFEYQLNQFGFKHPILRESFGFYSGLAELAITLQNSVKKSNKCVSHYRLKSDETLFDFYNPLNLIVDNTERDFSEYCKCKFFSSLKFDYSLLINDILNYFNYNNYDNNSVLMFFSRILYATEYFDKFEEIMNNNLHDRCIMKIVNKAKDYEIFIKKLYFKIKKRGYYIPQIEWIEKSNHI